MLRQIKRGRKEKSVREHQEGSSVYQEKAIVVGKHQLSFAGHGLDIWPALIGVPGFASCPVSISSEIQSCNQAVIHEQC